MELPYLQIVLMEKMLKMRGGGGKTRRKCPQISNKSPPKLAFFAEHSVYYLLTLIVLLEKEELEQSSMVYLPLWIPLSSSPAATGRQSRCGRRNPGVLWSLLALASSATKSRQNDNTHKYVAGDNTTISSIRFVVFCFGWGLAEKRRLRRMGINFAWKSDLSQSRRRRDTAHAGIPGKWWRAKVGTPYTWIDRSCRVSHCLSVCLYTHLSPPRGGKAEPQRNVQRLTLCSILQCRHINRATHGG